MQNLIPTKRQKYWGYYGTLEDQHENDPRRNKSFDCESELTQKTQNIKKSPREMKKNAVKPVNSNLKNGAKKVSNKSNKVQFSIIKINFDYKIK